MRNARALLASVLLAVPSALASADDVSVQLESGDALVVQDGAATETIRLDPQIGAALLRRVAVDPVDHVAANHVAVVSIGVDGGLDHAFATYRTDNSNKVGWIITSGGGMRSNASLIVDGQVSGFYDPVTGIVNGLNHALIPDGDNPGNTLPTMLQIGNDVEFNAILRTKTNTFPNGGALLVVDEQGEFRFQIDANGRLMFGPDGEASRAALDVVLERVDDGANDHLRLTTEGGDVIELMQQANIADPAGGSTVDVECRAALGQVLDLLETNGLMAP